MKKSFKIIKKGLLIGINYLKSSNELNGCINDTENLQQFLIKNKYFCDNELTFMNDNKTDILYPSKANMISKLNELVTFANIHQNEKVYMFLSYSGHGSYVIDNNGDEEDGKDEVLCPVDCDDNGFIFDDYLKSQFVDKLGSNVTLVVIIDACHSGSMLDLKYSYNCDTKNTYTVQGVQSESKCDIIMISGCRDNQTSADAYIADNVTKVREFQGAMTAAFINNYSDEISTIALITKMRGWLKTNGYSQVPQVSSGKLIDMSKPFMLSIFNN